MTDILTNSGKIVVMNRAYKSSPDYTAPANFRVGINNGTPVAADTDLDYAVPISDGTTLDDGSNTMTGSDGGDNSTDNTDTYKQGAGNTDAKAQNLIANNTNTSKVWTIADLAVAGSNATGTQFIACWIYIKDATTLSKFKTAGTCLEIRVGSSASDYYAIEYTAADLAVGWNWVTGNTTALEDLTETGTVAGDLDTFAIEITTNNATDTFVAGDVIYDLLRQWETSDLIQSFVSGYPSLDEVTYSVTIKGYLDATKANGFLINAAALENTDSTPKRTDISDFGGESKADTDEFALVFVNTLSQG